MSARTDEEMIAKLGKHLRICDGAALKGLEFLKPAILSTLVTFGNVAIARMITKVYLDHPGTASPSIIAAWVYAALTTDLIYPDSPTFQALCAAYYQENPHG